MKKMFLFFIFKSSLCMSQDYKVMPVDELLKMITNRNEQFEFTDKETMAKVYKCESQYILLPAIGQRAILIQSKSVLDSIIKSGVIPIEEENPNYYQQEKNRLINVDKNLGYYFHELSSKLQIPMNEDYEIDASFYKIINRKIKHSEPEKSYQTYFITLGIVIGENVRRKVKGDWKLDTRFGYNPYYVPYILDSSNQKYNPWYKLADMLLNKKYDIKKHIENASEGKSYL